MRLALRRDTLTAMVLLVVAGSLGCSSPLVIRGRVVDDATARPIEGALVVATWIEHRGNHFACYHVETAQTSSDGTVAMTVTLAPPRERESSTPLAFPDIAVCLDTVIANHGR